MLNGDGTVDKVTVIRPSGYLPFDVAAIDVVYSAGPYADPPRAIRSRNGKIYVHWTFHRDERQCATSGVDYFILDNPPAGGDIGESEPAWRPGCPTRGRAQRTPRAAGRPHTEPRGDRGLRRLDRGLGGRGRRLAGPPLEEPRPGTARAGP